MLEDSFRNIAATTKSQAKIKATITAKQCMPGFRELVMSEGRTFDSLDLPRNQQQANVFSATYERIEAKLHAIKYASQKAKRVPTVCDEIHELAMKFCEEATLENDVSGHFRALIADVDAYPLGPRDPHRSSDWCCLSNSPCLTSTGLVLVP